MSSWGEDDFFMTEGDSTKVTYGLIDGDGDEVVRAVTGQPRYA